MGKECGFFESWTNSPPQPDHKRTCCLYCGAWGDTRPAGWVRWWQVQGRETKKRAAKGLTLRNDDCSLLIQVLLIYGWRGEKGIPWVSLTSSCSSRCSSRRHVVTSRVLSFSLTQPIKQSVIFASSKSSLISHVFWWSWNTIGQSY